MKPTIKVSKKATTTIGCLWIAATLILILLQIVFLTLKLAGSVSWNWLVVLTPTICVIGFPLAIIVIAVIVLVPKVLIEDRRRRKRVEAEAKKYGMERKPGESTGDLKKRIVQRNMITGNYSRKDIKDEILRAFPNVGSCQILVNNQTDEIVLIPRSAETEIGAAAFTDDELQEIAEFAAQYIPVKYKVTIRRAKEETNGSAET